MLVFEEMFSVFFIAVKQTNHISHLLLFAQCVKHICNAMDKQTAAVSEEFYDNLVTCDINSVDCLITALVVEPSVIQRLKGELIH